MAQELEFFYTTASVLYAKSSPLDYSTWSNGIETMAELGFGTGFYYADVATPELQYTVFLQAGGSPAASDTPLGNINYGVDVRQIDGAATIDTLSLTSLFETLLAFVGGETSVSTLTATSKRIIMYKQDGSTEKLRIDFDADGQWTATVIS